MACGFNDKGSVDPFCERVMFVVPYRAGVAFDNWDAVHFMAETDCTGR